jgi:hypothetical protein
MSPRTTKRTRWTAKDAQEILDLWKTSGLSLQRFAKQQGVQVQRLLLLTIKTGDRYHSGALVPDIAIVGDFRVVTGA